MATQDCFICFVVIAAFFLYIKYVYLPEAISKALGKAKALAERKDIQETPEIKVIAPEDMKIEGLKLFFCDSRTQLIDVKKRMEAEGFKAFMDFKDDEKSFSNILVLENKIREFKEKYSKSLDFFGITIIEAQKRELKPCYFVSAGKDGLVFYSKKDVLNGKYAILGIRHQS